MATTWAASAPDTAAQKYVQQAGLGSGYGAPTTSVAVDLKWPGNKRAKLTKLTATGTYSTGGDAVTASDVGLSEIHAAFLVDAALTNVTPVIDATASSGTPAFLVSAGVSTKIQYFDDGVETAAGATLTGDSFHVVLVGV